MLPSFGRQASRRERRGGAGEGGICRKKEKAEKMGGRLNAPTIRGLQTRHVCQSFDESPPRRPVFSRRTVPGQGNGVWARCGF